MKNQSNLSEMCHQGIWVWVDIIGTHRKILASLESISEVDSTSHYREPIILQYLMYITMRRECSALWLAIHYI